MKMPQAVQMLPLNERQALMQWLTRDGPFWDDVRKHEANDYLECNGKIVTDTSIGEAAYNCFQGTNSQLISLTPSAWEFSPIIVDWNLSSENFTRIEINNHWDEQKFRVILQNASTPIVSWQQLEEVCLARCPQLKFSKDCFTPLQNQPFVSSVAIRIQVLLDTLERFKGCFNDQGERTPEGHQIQKDHFEGDKAWFSDSSVSEKADFRDELEFKHPAQPNKKISCTWHGKIKTPQYRIHFSSPVTATEPLYVVYVGPKITKR
jgi:hypothetical protein